MEFSDGLRTPLREISVTDYHLIVDSLDPDVVAFAPMVASHHPRVIAVGEGKGDLLRVTLLLADECRAAAAAAAAAASTRRAPSAAAAAAAAAVIKAGTLATATATVDVDFTASELPQRPDFVQNDGGGVGSSSGNGNSGVGSHGIAARDRKHHREVMSDLEDILIGKLTSYLISLFRVVAQNSTIIIELYDGPESK